MSVDLRSEDGGSGGVAQRSAIRAEHVGVVLGGEQVLSGIDLEVADGEWLALLGPNGAGKTTLVRALSGTVRHTGTVRIGATAADAATRVAGPRARARRIAVVPQAPIIPPGITAFEYVLLGRTPHQGLRLSASLDDRRRSLAVLQRLDLERFAQRDLATLSGGERQRVVLARALVADAPVLVLDEPTAALDLGHQFEILELLAELQQERGLTVVTTLHDLGIAGQFGDRLAVLHEGRLVAHGSPAQVLTPEAIGRWWGVEADVEADPLGRVSVTVRRRGRTGPSVTEPVTGPVTGALAATESAAPGTRVQEPT
jgi:iron complex transport system ATP-binding protein